ncbi:MAG: hypothetical protein NTX45_13295 [Proteobacteria bacterium]|nr:hypothetical protein [Pseudomonadota bacterium]
MFLKYKQQKSSYNSDKLLTEEQRRQKIGDCLIKLAQRNPFFEIKDAVLGNAKYARIGLCLDGKNDCREVGL